MEPAGHSAPLAPGFIDLGPILAILLLAVVLTPRFVTSPTSLPAPDPSRLGRRRLGIRPLRDLALGVPALLAILWLGAVSRNVPEPYLDEVFHVPQAQRYCEGRYWDWDDKITTPPGLYAVSVFVHGIYSLILPAPPPCSVTALRSLNVVAVLAVGILAALCRHGIETRLVFPSARQGPAPPPLRAFSAYAVHTAVNVSLFPVLFFFSALYYTDVASTAAVLLAYRHQLSRLGRPGKRNGIGSDAASVLLGVAALCMRQTNVFWVVVFMGGLEAVDAAKSLRSPPAVARGVLGQLVGEWSAGRIYDPPVDAAWLDDWFLCVASLAVAALSNPLRVLRRVWPHLAVLGLFLVFVARNGGVVLGDKSNHVATIHLAQMVYLWPLFIFFSAPLLIPVLLSAAGHVTTGRARDVKESSSTDLPKATGGAGPVASIFRNKSYYWFQLVATGAVFVLVAGFNTIVHPFTLADNRHYTFYVFRLVMRRPRAVRYVLAVGCAVCLLLAWTLLGLASPHAGPVGSGSGSVTGPLLGHPFLDRTAAATDEKVDSNPDETADGRKTEYYVAFLDDLESRATSPATLSTVLLLLLATTLSLVTAPLIEPRYVIIPWVMWRLLVPARKTPQPTAPGERGKGILSRLIELGRRYDLRLFAETAWHVLINLATMAAFLMRPYVWRAEDGSVLDGGRLQRFMW